MEAPPVGGLGGTYGGNPIACRAALAVLELLDSQFLQRATELGDILRTRFLELQEKFSIIGNVRGLGPMIGIELVKDRKTKEPAADLAKELVNRCLNNGLITLACGNYGNVIRTLMPLIITDEQLEQGLAIMEEQFATL